MFPLHIEDVSGYYHYRIMVNYPVSMHRIEMTQREEMLTMFDNTGNVNPLCV